MVIEVDMEAIRQDNAAGEQIKTIIERVERLEEEKAGIQGDIKDVFAEAKANGFDTKVIKRIIRERKRDRDDLANEEAMLDIYKQAIGEA